MKEVLLVGFGAVGAVYSLILKRSSLARVTVVARGNYALVKEHGMHIKSEKFGDVTGWRPDRLCKSVADAADQRYDYVFVTTKSIPDVVTTSSILSPLLSPPYSDQFAQPVYFLLQNGMNVELDLYQSVVKLGKGEPKIVSSAVFIGANLLEPNVVEHNTIDRSTIGWFRFQDYTTLTNTPEQTQYLDELRNLLIAGGSQSKVVPEIQRSKFAKNFWNIAFSSFATLTGYRLPSMYRPPPSGDSERYEPYLDPTTANLVNEYTIPNIQAIMDELLLIGRALGFPDSEDGLPARIVHETMHNTKILHEKPDSTHTPSMLLDAQKGYPIEVEVIVGEVVRMARAHSVPTPRLEMIYALLLVVQNQIVRKRQVNKL